MQFMDQTIGLKLIMDRLLLLSGNDIPLMGVGLQLHPPKLKEIAYLGETKFFSGLELLKFSKKSLKMDKNQLEVLTDFDIIMKIMEDKSQDFKEIREERMANSCDSD